MTVSLKHSFQSTNSDGPDTNLVQPSNWNAEHTLTCDTAKILGRTTAGTGAVEELSVNATLALAAGVLGVTPGAYVTPTGTETLTNKTLTSPAINTPTITGGSISGITDLAIADGGTGASTAAAAFANIAIAASALTATGYIKFQNGFYIIWGTFTAAANGTTAVSYPAAVDLTSFSRVMVSGGLQSTTAQDNNPTAVASSTSGFTAYSALDSTATCQYIAIGV